MTPSLLVPMCPHGLRHLTDRLLYSPYSLPQVQAAMRRWTQSIMKGEVPDPAAYYSRVTTGMFTPGGYKSAEYDPAQLAGISYSFCCSAYQPVGSTASVTSTSLVEWWADDHSGRPSCTVLCSELRTSSGQSLSYVLRDQEQLGLTSGPPSRRVLFHPEWHADTGVEAFLKSTHGVDLLPAAAPFTNGLAPPILDLIKGQYGAMLLPAGSEYPTAILAALLPTLVARGFEFCVITPDARMVAWLPSLATETTQMPDPVLVMSPEVALTIYSQVWAS